MCVSSITHRYGPNNKAEGIGYVVREAVFENGAPKARSLYFHRHRGKMVADRTSFAYGQEYTAVATPRVKYGFSGKTYTSGFHVFSDVNAAIEYLNRRLCADRVIVRVRYSGIRYKAIQDGIPCLVVKKVKHYDVVAHVDEECAMPIDELRCAANELSYCHMVLD